MLPPPTAVHTQLGGPPRSASQRCMFQQMAVLNLHVTRRCWAMVSPVLHATRAGSGAEICNAVQARQRGGVFLPRIKQRMHRFYNAQQPSILHAVDQVRLWYFFQPCSLSFVLFVTARRSSRAETLTPRHPHIYFCDAVISAAQVFLQQWTYHAHMPVCAGVLRGPLRHHQPLVRTLTAH
jgi:hypothetical protein